MDYFVPEYNRYILGLDEFNKINRIDLTLHKMRIKNINNVDYGCGFDSAGHCARSRSELAKISQLPFLKRTQKFNNFGSYPRCCCVRCFDAAGYYHWNGFYEGDLKTYHDLFKENVGFWRFGTGCSLPRELRSRTCLTYICTFANSKASEEVRAQIQ